MFYKGEIPFVRFLIPLILGISCGYFYPSEFSGLLLTFLLSCIGIFLIIITVYKKFAIYKFPWLSGLIVQLILFTGAYWLTVKQSQKFDAAHYSLHKSDAFIIRVANEPKLSKGILRLEAIVTDRILENRIIPSTGKLLLSIQTDSVHPAQVKYGDVLLVPALFNAVDPPYNPGEFDYRNYLSNHQIYYQSFVQVADIHVINRDRGNAIISFALNLRKVIVDKFAKYIHDKDAAAFASTLILGYRAELSPELINAYSKTGTMHVLSVSGMHVGIVFIVLTFLLKFMDKNQALRLVRASLVIAIIWFYALITGFSAPACRAAVMLSFVVLGKAINKNQNTYNLIAISAFFLLLYNPYYLFDAGFQLSYLAVAGLVYFHPKIYQLVSVKNKILDYSWSYCALSIGAQLATFPISIYYFHQFPVYFLISNLIIVLPAALIMYAGILFMFVPSVYILIYLGRFLDWLITFTNNLLYYIENLPFSSWGGIWITSFEYVLMYMIILYAVLRISFRYRSLTIISVLSLCLSISIVTRDVKNYKRREIIFYNLRKNTAIAYLNRGESIVISDISADDKLASYSITPALNSKGSEDITFFKPEEKISAGNYYQEDNFFQLANYRILRWDKSFNNKTFSRMIDVQAVIVSGSPGIKISEIKSAINFEILIIDANNADYKVKEWIRQAEELHIKYYSLKKNPAYLVTL